MKEIIHFYRVENLANVKRFYEELMGFTLYKDQKKCLIYDCNGQGKIGFCIHHPKAMNNATCITFVYETKDEVLKKYRFFKDHGFDIEPPEINQMFKIYHFYLKDYEGLTLEFQSFIKS